MTPGATFGRGGTVPRARLDRLADEVWAGSGLAHEYPRPIEQLVAARLPLVVVRLPAVTVAAVREWLARQGVAGGLGGGGSGGGPLFGFLFARYGYGYAFVCDADPPDEQRLTVAHEAAHFLLDYLGPRRRVLAALGPAAAEVLDGRRPPTLPERSAALLAHVRLGPHVHRFPRGRAGTRSEEGEGTDVGRAAEHADDVHDDGGDDDPVLAAAEADADALALELVAPRARVVELVRRWADRRRCRNDGPSPSDATATTADVADLAAAMAAHFEVPAYAFGPAVRAALRPQHSPLLRAARAAAVAARPAVGGRPTNGEPT